MLHDERPRSTSSWMSLDQLVPGSWAEVVQVQGPARWRRRLYAMGFRPGTRVYVEHRAPLGDPVQYWVQDTWMVLRRQTARYIWVRPVSAGSEGASEGVPSSQED